MNEMLMNRMKLVCNPSIKKCNTSQGLMQLSIKIQEYVIKATSHNVKQQILHQTLLS